MVHEIALTIKPTMKCNMKCRHCFNGDSLNGSEMLPVYRSGLQGVQRRKGDVPRRRTDAGGK